MVNALWVRQIWFLSSQIQAKSQARQVQQGLLTRVCALHTGSPRVPTFPCEGWHSSCLGHANPAVPCPPRFDLAGGTGATCSERGSHGEQALWKKLFWQNHTAQQGDFYRERGPWKCRWWLRSVVLVGNELVWVMLLTASSLHRTASLVPIHQLLTDPLSYLPAKGEVDVMDHLFLCFWWYYICKSNMPCDEGEVWWGFTFPEGVQSTSWGLWTDMCDSFCRELTGLVEWICQMFPSLQLHAVWCDEDDKNEDHELN